MNRDIPHNTFDKQNTTASSASGNSYGNSFRDEECRDRVNDDLIQGGLDRGFITEADPSQTYEPFDLQNFNPDNLYVSINKRDYFKMERVINLKQLNNHIFEVVQQGTNGLPICDTKLFMTVDPRLARGLDTNYPRLDKTDTNTIRQLLDDSMVMKFIDDNSDPVRLYKPSNPKDFDNTASDLYCVDGNNIYIFKNVEHIEFDRQKITITFDNDNVSFINKNNIFTSSKFSVLNTGEDMLYSPVFSSKEKPDNNLPPFKFSNYNPTDDNLVVDPDSDGTLVMAGIEQDPSNPNNYIIVYTNIATRQIVRTAFPKSSINNFVMVQKKQKKQIIVFTPFDYKHFQSYKSMYSVYCLINSNILIEITDFDPKSDSDAYPITYKPVAFIPTDKFFGYLPDYKFDTRNDESGYYYKDYTHIGTIAEAKLTATNKSEEKKQEVTDAAENVRVNYNNYYSLKKELQEAVDVKNEADNKYRLTEYNLGTLPVTATVSDRNSLTTLQTEARETKNNADNDIVRLNQEISDAKVAIQTAINNKKNIEDNIVNLTSPDEIDDINISKTVSRQLIFLVNKKYLQQKNSTEYIVIDYKSKYKINPFINKNITNFDYNIYELYKAYPDSCKIFFHNYNYQSSFTGKQHKDDTVIRIEKIELVSKTETVLDDVIIKNLAKKLTSELTDFQNNFQNPRVIIGPLNVEEEQKRRKKLIEKTNKITSIYSKLVDFESDFTKYNDYLKDEDKFYEQVYKLLEPNNWEQSVIDVENQKDIDEIRLKTVINNAQRIEAERIKNAKIAAVNTIKNVVTLPADRTVAETTLRNLEALEKRLMNESALYTVNNDVNNAVGDAITSFVDNRFTAGIVSIPSIEFYEIVISMSTFIKEKYQRFLKSAVELNEQGIELGNESLFFLDEANNDINNQQLYEDIALKKHDESQIKSTESGELFDKLYRAHDELNKIYIICKICLVSIRLNVNAYQDDPIYGNMLDILGNISETQGLIAEKFEDNFKEALKYYQRAQVEYHDTSQIKERAHRLDKKNLFSLLSSRNDEARDISNIGRVLKKLGDISRSDQQFIAVQTIYNFIFKKLDEFKNLLISGDVFKMFYDYAMFLISQNKFTEARKYLEKADEAINKKTKGNMVKGYIDKLISGTILEDFIDKDLGPYNLVVMNIKRELDYLLKTLEPNKYFYLFDNKLTSYSIKYTDKSKNIELKDVSSELLFLQYSYQNNYNEDKTIPIPVTKIITKLNKPLDINLYNSYNKEPQSYIVIYTDKSNPDNFITTAIQQMPNVVTKPLLTSELLKPVIRGGGKTYKIVYYDDFGNIESKDIDDNSLFIINITQVKPGDGKTLNNLMIKATTLSRKPETDKKGTSKPGTATGLSSKNKISYQTNNTNNLNQIVPNELKIVINTSVPGFQKIMYSPNMTIRNISERSVRFDPLVKLDLSVINSVPENLRIKEFFNKGLFESLINFHGMEKVRSLIEAMNEGIINNNILVTLKTIFAINTPIYINNEVYYIADVQWTPGDWTIDTKEKPVAFDMSKIKNPYVYSAIVNEDIISGQKQIKDLPQNLLTGANYKGLPPQKYSEATGLSPLLGGPGISLQRQPQVQPQLQQRVPVKIVPTINVEEAPTEAINVAAPISIAPLPINVPQPLQIAPQPLPIAQAPAINAAPQINSGLLPAPPPIASPPIARRYTSGLLPPPQASPVRKPNTQEDIASEISEKRSASNVSTAPHAPIEPLVFTFNSGNTSFFRGIFGKTSTPSFFGNMDTLFKEMVTLSSNEESLEMKDAVSNIKDIENNITSVIVKKNSLGLSSGAYCQTVGGICGGEDYRQIGLRVSDPDNFFESVTKAMNQYNYNSQEINNKIGTVQGFMTFKGRGGPGNPIFTPVILKTEVKTFLQSHTAIVIQLLDEATNFVAEINRIFGETLDADINSYNTASGTVINRNPDGIGVYDNNYVSLYDTTANKIFKQYYKFGLVKPNNFITMTPDEKTRINTPFTIVVNNEVSIKDYIDGDSYLPGVEAITALNINLKLNIIVISKRSEPINPGGPNINFINIDNANNIFYDIINARSGLNYGKWDKFLFLYKETSGLSSGNYGVITFTYKLKQSLVSKSTPSYMFTIFKKNNIQFSPPLYMLYTIFYLKYLDNGTSNRDKFVFYPQIIKGFYTAFMTLIDNPNGPGKWTYFDNAYMWFKTRALKDTIKAMGRGYDTGFITGGAENSNRNRNRSNSNRNRSRSNSNNDSNNFLKREDVRDLSKIGYYISIDLELKKGSPLTQDELKQSKCTQKWNTVRKAFANFSGKTYTIPPVYDYSTKQTLKNKQNQQNQNVTRRNNPNVNPNINPNVNPNVNPNGQKTGGTRKNEEIKKIYLGKHSKTRKKYN